MAIVSPDDLRSFMNVTDTAQDTFLTKLAIQVDAAIKQYLGGRDLEQTTYPGAADGGNGDSGYYSGDDSRYIFLRQWPVTSIASLYYDPTGYFGKNPDGSFDPTLTVLTEGVDFVLHYDGCLPGLSTQCSYRAIVERITGVWPGQRFYRTGRILPEIKSAMGNLKISYTAGYPAVPADLVVAACELAAVLRAQRTTGRPLQQESYDNYSFAYAQVMLNTLPELGSIRQLLAKYRRLPPL